MAGRRLMSLDIRELLRRLRARQTHRSITRELGVARKRVHTGTIGVLGTLSPRASRCLAHPPVAHAAVSLKTHDVLRQAVHATAPTDSIR